MYYVYTLSRPDGSVFYVGKGQRDRMYKHVQEARAGHKCPKCSVIRKHGYQITYGKIALFEDEQAAFDAERDLIEQIGLENLTNIRGGGGKAYTVTPEHRLKLAANRAGKPMPVEAKVRIAALLTGHEVSPETRAKISVGHKGKKPSPQTIAAIVEANAGHYVGFVAPDGTEYPDVVNMSAFCREHGLSRSTMARVANGVRKQYKGWTRLERSNTNAA